MKINQSAPVKAAYEIEVEAKPEVIWDILVAARRWPNWNPDIRATDVQGNLEAGSKFSWKAGPGTIHSTVMQLQMPHLLLWTGSTPGIKAVHLWVLERRGERTLVRSEESWEGLLPSILRGIMKRMLSKSIRQSLIYLKAEAERVSS